MPLLARPGASICPPRHGRYAGGFEPGANRCQLFAICTTTAGRSPTSKQPVPEQDKPLPVSSSRAPLFAPEQEQLFREVLTLLNDCKVPYVVSGAFALLQHTGIGRDTKDLDVFLTADDVPHALHCLSQAGFACEICDPVWLAKAHRNGFFVDLITGMSNAVVRVDPSWIERGRPARIVGVTTKVLAPEELIASKLFVTRRERFDGADIVHVIHGTQGQLDWHRILALAGEHWEIVLWALVLFHYVYPAHSDYVPRPLWEELLSRFREAVASPRPDATFRGSLIDENMFAIDVQEWGMEDILGKERARLMRKIPQSVKTPCEVETCSFPDPSHLL